MTKDNIKKLIEKYGIYIPSEIGEGRFQFLHPDNVEKLAQELHNSMYFQVDNLCCYSCGEEIKMDKKGNYECYCNECKPEGEVK